MLTKLNNIQDFVGKTIKGVINEVHIHNEFYIIIFDDDTIGIIYSKGNCDIYNDIYWGSLDNGSEVSDAFIYSALYDHQAISDEEFNSFKEKDKEERALYEKLKKKFEGE